MYSLLHTLIRSSFWHSVKKNKMLKCNLWVFPIITWGRHQTSTTQGLLNVTQWTRPCCRHSITDIWRGAWFYLRSVCCSLHPPSPPLVPPACQWHHSGWGFWLAPASGPCCCNRTRGAGHRRCLPSTSHVASASGPPSYTHTHIIFLLQWLQCTLGVCLCQQVFHVFSIN